jgi:hypothetical protein
LGTPHFGSPLANALQQSTDVVTIAAVIAILDQGGFNNANGNPCQVDFMSPGFTDLRTDSAFLANLNANIGVHPQVRAFTIAGTSLGEFQDVDQALGVTTDDGLVTVASANPPALGPVASGTAPVDHIQLPLDTVTTFPLVRSYLMQ